MTGTVDQPDEPDNIDPSNNSGDADGIDIGASDDMDAELDAMIDNEIASDPSLAMTLDEVNDLIAERDRYKDLAMRTQADFENYRKRSATQAAADVERATGRLAEAMLPVLDAAESAYVQHPDEVGPLLNVMLLELKKQGLEALDLAGKPFDPEVAEAVAHEPGSGGEVVVAEVLRSGYSWHGKTLRPAMVRTTD